MLSKTGRLDSDSLPLMAQTNAWRKEAGDMFFYQTVVANAFFFATVCWEGGIRAGYAAKKHPSNWSRRLARPWAALWTGLRWWKRWRSINLTPFLDNNQHPLHDLLAKQQSFFSRRIIQLCCKKEQYRRWSGPTAITLYNSSSQCWNIIYAMSQSQGLCMHLWQGFRR